MEDRVQGIWWLSDQPENRVAGDLHISDARLELNGTFEEIESGASFGSKPRLMRPNQEKTILGITRSKAKKYTVEFFDNPNYTITMPGYKADTYSLGTIFEDEHFDKVSDLTMNRYYVEFPYLLEWVGETTIRPTMVIDTSTQPQSRDTTIKVDNPLVIQFYENDIFRLSFVIIPNGVSFGPTIKSMHLRQNCQLKIESLKTDLTMKEMQAIASHFARFLMIATGKYLGAIGHQGIPTSDSGSVHIYTRSSNNREYKDISSHEMNFTFQDIKNDSQSIFDKWFDDRDKHTDVFDLFSSIRSDSSKNLNNRFRDIVSAIEGYVAIEEQTHEVSPSRAAKILNENLPKADRLLKPSDYDKIRITRNKLSHLKIRPDDEQYSLDIEGRWMSYHKLLFLLEYALLQKLGLQDELLKSFYNKCVWK